MKDVTKEMIKIFKLKKLGCDFMGYEFVNPNELSFHHLIVARKDSQVLGIGDGYLFWNGAILRQKTSHDYLHLIERIESRHGIHTIEAASALGYGSRENELIEIDD